MASRLAYGIQCTQLIVAIACMILSAFPKGALAQTYYCVGPAYAEDANGNANVGLCASVTDCSVCVYDGVNLCVDTVEECCGTLQELFANVSSGEYYALGCASVITEACTGIQGPGVEGLWTGTTCACTPYCSTNCPGDYDDSILFGTECEPGCPEDTGQSGLLLCGNGEQPISSLLPLDNAQGLNPMAGSPPMMQSPSSPAQSVPSVPVQGQPPDEKTPSEPPPTTHSGPDHNVDTSLLTYITRNMITVLATIYTLINTVAL